MGQPLYSPSRPQSIGEVLDTALRLFRISLLRTLPYAVIAVVATQLQTVYDVGSGSPLLVMHWTDPVWSLLYVGGLLTSTVLTNALLLRVAAIGRGQPVDVGRELRRALARLPAQIGLGLLVTLGLVVLSVILIGPGFFLNSLVLKVLGTLLLIVPCLYWSCALAMSWPALVVVGTGPFTSLTYGGRLVRGNWWRTSAIFSIGFAILLVCYLLAGVVTAAVVPLAGATRDVAVALAIWEVLAAAAGAFITPFAAALMLATFWELQVRKDGADLELRIGATSGDSPAAS